MKTRELTGRQLDWAVATAEGEEYLAEREHNSIGMEFEPHRYSTNWSQGGPIIERERIHVCPITYNDGPAVQAWPDAAENPKPFVHGPTALVAAMRCYVLSKLGDEIHDIPKELL